MTAKISAQYLGGVANGDNLTGSCILLEINKGKRTTKILVDSGLLQCDFKSSRKRNEEILTQLNPATVDCIILTHSHIDHSGRLPLMVKNGFKGRIFATKPTGDLLRIMLPDSANIQASEADYLNWKRRKAEKNNFQANQKGMCGNFQKSNEQKGKIENDFGADIQPLYTMQDVENTFDLIKNGGYEYDEWIRLGVGISLKFFPSGHVLGGAICLLRIKESSPEKCRYIGFSGDLGREDGIILPPPEKIEEPVDYWFIESTYGNKEHPARDAEIKTLLELIGEVEAEKKIMIIPSFTLERVQEILYLLSYYMHVGEIAKLPIILDSPLALQITKVFAEYWHTNMFKDQGILPFNPFEISENPYFTAAMSKEESAAMSKADGPRIVIAGSGMCDAGRIRHHLRENLSNSNAVVCLIGYMASGSLGGKLKDHFPLIKMNGIEIPVNAKIVAFESFSAHADAKFLTAYTKSVIRKKGGRGQKILIGHGSVIGGLGLKRNIIDAFKPYDWKEKVLIPDLNQKIKLM